MKSIFKIFEVIPKASPKYFTRVISPVQIAIWPYISYSTLHSTIQSIKDFYEVPVPSGLFLDLPEINTEEDINRIKMEHPDWDRSFIACAGIPWVRDIYEKLWPPFEPYADSNFRDAIKRNFSHRAWEMYFGNILLSKGFKLDSRNEGPDFVVDAALYIECVATTRGEDGNPDSVPDIVVRRGESPLARPVPVEQAILRITQSIKSKVEQYRGWSTKTWFDPTVPYVIAINTSKFYIPDGSDWPYVMQAVLGIGNKYVSFIPGSDETAVGWNNRYHIRRANGSLVETTAFLTEDYSEISGIIFTNTDAINSRGDMGSDCSIVNNPFAINQLPDLIKCFPFWSVENIGDGTIRVSKPS